MEIHFNLKPNRLKKINESFEDNINFHNETIKEKDNKTAIFRYISDLNVNNENIKEIISF